MASTPPTTTEHEHGVPSWPRWRIAFMLWQSAADWRTRWRAVRMVATRQAQRNRIK